MTISIFIFIIIVHWITDFILQDEKWALGKSKSLIPLLKHTFTYSLLWLVPVFVMTGDIFGSLMFVKITFVAHTITDYITSKIVSNRFEEKYYGSSIPNFGAFTIIGFDQVLHYLQLIFTWMFLFT